VTCSSESHGSIVGGGRERGLDERAPFVLGTGVVRCQRAHEFGLGLVGDHLEEVGQMLALGGELHDRARDDLCHWDAARHLGAPGLEVEGPRLDSEHVPCWALPGWSSWSGVVDVGWAVARARSAPRRRRRVTDLARRATVLAGMGDGGAAHEAPRPGGLVLAPREGVERRRRGRRRGCPPRDVRGTLEVATTLLVARSSDAKPRGRDDTTRGSCRPCVCRRARTGCDGAARVRANGGNRVPRSASRRGP